MKTETNQGVVYAINDLAGIGRRILIVLIDAVVLMILLFLLSIATVFIEPGNDMLVILCAGMSFLYLAGLPASSLGTVGYRATGVHLVDLRGQRAALWRSTFRFGFLVFGPLNLLADIIWLGGDPNRQSIRDKFAGTYVVRRKAMPIGSAPIRYKTYYMLTYNLIFAEVERKNPEPTQSSERPQATPVE